MPPFVGAQYFFLIFCWIQGLAGQLGMPFLSFNGRSREVKFGWWENWVLLHQSILTTHFASIPLLYIKLIVQCPVRFSLFYRTSGFLHIFPETLSDNHCH